MEVIPQRVFYYEDGVLPYKSGEWPGIKSSRWRGSKLILKPIQKENQVCSLESKLKITI